MEVILNLHNMEFEKRKELLALLLKLLKIKLKENNPLLKVFLEFKDSLIKYALEKYSLTHFHSYSTKGMTYCAGSLLRMFLEQKELHKSLLTIRCLESLSELITDPRFDVASDAVESFMVIS